MTYEEVMNELKTLGTEQSRKIYLRHGADLPMFGVSIANIKKLAKKNKNNHDLGVQLFNSSNIDAIYLSQYILDVSLLTIDDLERIAMSTHYYMILDNVIANLAAKNKEIAFTCLRKWIQHDDHRFRQIAYSLYTLILLSYDNELIDSSDVFNRVKHVRETIHSEENRVRYSMNSFLIQAAVTFPEFTKPFKDLAKEIGKVNVHMGETSCKVPDAYTYIEKIEKMGNIGKKRKI